MDKNEVEIVSVVCTRWERGWLIRYRYAGKYFTDVVTAPDEVGAIAAFYKRKLEEM